MSSSVRSGKTAPRLAQDIYDYDPVHPPGTGRNLLSEVPPVFAERQTGSLEFISPSACRHQYVTKPNQSFLPQAEQKKSTGNPSKVSAICTECRYHLQLVVSSSPGIGQSTQGFADHIHHLVYKSGRQRNGVSPAEVTPKGQIVETFHYECSYLTCPVSVSVRIASPVLAEEWVRLLIDPEVLGRRADEAIAAQPERLEGIGRPLPITVLENLHTYIFNALHDSQRSKSISAVNKRFMTCFGVEGRPCKSLLEFLGFSVKNEGFWEPPRPNPWAEYPYQDQLKIFLDDVLHELSALIEQRPATEKKGRQPPKPPHPSFDDLLYAMDALDYPKSLRSNEFQMAPAPYYEDLGVVEDMSSSSVVEAFNRQVSVDPARSSLYLQCLKSIGNLRGSDDAQVIDTAVQVAYAEGRYTDEDVIEAYRYFGLAHDDPHLTEDSIIGKFYAFMSSTTQENESRMRLWRIGDSRRSERIKSAAEDRVATVEQAQVFLGVDSSTSDEFVLTMYTTKVNDNPASRDIARRAVELIAESRKSAVLTHFVRTGEMTAGEMDVADAYRLLQIPDRTVDDAAIMAAYTICVDEAPGQAEKYNQALTIIAKDKNSSLLSSMISGPDADSGRDLSEWPVGLQNIGNTCYLNSLLQFYFSIRPFREMVLDYESFRMELDDESLSKKHVGSRKVLKKEVERSQTFLRELRTLFQDMITSSRSFVTPGQELARLTLISPSNEAAIRRRSTISMSRPGGLGEVNGMPIMGPLGPPQLAPEPERSQNPVDAEKEKPKHPTISDVDSEATLVSDSVKLGTPLLPEDKENETPSKDIVMSEVQPEPASQNNEDNISPKDETPAIPFGPPNQPPPVPPRSTVPIDPQKQLLEEVEIGAQQDVTEVINNVLFQSQCAIKPIAFAPDGEQLDQVKDLFYGRSKSYILAEAGTRSKEEWWCDIKVDVATGSRDIYAAIDGAFDAQKVNVDNTIVEQYSAISKLPPVLQIQVQRVQFDPIKKSSFKSTHHLELKEKIYLDRYMDTQHPEIMNRRRQCWEWKNTLKTLEERRAELLRQSENDGLDMATLFESAKSVVEDLNSFKDNPETAEEAIDINPQLSSELGQLSQIVKAELNYVEQEIKNTQTLISSQFVDFKHLAYRLYAVFVHHGSVEFGHYYIYIFDFRKNVWRKYNDNEVTEVQNPDEIFKNQERQNPPTPYFLVYVNDALKDRLVDPVCRQIIDNMAHSEPVSGTEPTLPMEGVTTTTPVPQEDLNMDSPAYDEAFADNYTSGTGAALRVEKDRKGPVDVGSKAPTSSWPSNNLADQRDVEW
ncbi:ubiquitin-specific protease UBP2 [Aspergillus clavatus NRRL 1]|uniref:ubiquitinyl hydrolase 1 n=1 Tax=Aspergillus clavatus (strain ATCC 1007 / CBS 513.65 / DSM 816 / NCTC 3887 / NRRL 1 / QM 1276 / 107) TaxID=344612 RepID=A1CU69_ASPCL|nr:ubiquitin carboxyl-terminal hydrolase, putative [Aspergillus clavatus NRRL 1]EAW06856.1 ubiquitin carboxyl-terminal hydrolase, putative [Aspergillus clavatus NRRL 1]